MNQTSSTERCHHDYESYAAHGSPPAYDFPSEYINPPAYCYGSLFGISDDIDAWIAGRTPYCYLSSCEQVYHFTNTARRHRRKLTQVPSVIEAVRNASSAHRRLRTVWLKSLPAAIIHDFVAPPYHLTQMAISLSRSKFERMRADAGILDEVLESLWLSLVTAVKMVTRLGLETHEAVERKFKNGEGHIFLVIARFLEAYGSRFAPSGTVFLASHKRLPKEHCFGTARLHFGQIHDLKGVLMFVGLFPAQDLDAFAVLERCLRKVYPALQEPFADSDDEPGFSHIVQRLRHVQDEMPGLVSFDTRK
ncbi:hypothetical protein ONS95_014825 [Cadophora gregata]|uniref:uncharacterized protein n=1 Tax=Cadophora gregata TaxID=51156 RepID=UPI0026DD7A1D|nr:uncharacterized protein ONS95_014825 [Cadophora gregata]KAK0113121.1 hypothetical protein ONS95_014825 [Cadophora gregata]